VACVQGRAKDWVRELAQLDGMADGLVPAVTKACVSAAGDSSLEPGQWRLIIGPGVRVLRAAANIGLWVGVRAALSPQSQKLWVAAGRGGQGWRRASGRSLAFSSLLKVAGAISRAGQLRAVLWGSDSS